MARKIQRMAERLVEGEFDIMLGRLDRTEADLMRISDGGKRLRAEEARRRSDQSFSLYHTLNLMLSTIEHLGCCI